MEKDLTPHLLIPSCADCDAIAIREQPELICELEKAFGFEVLKTFLFAYGGRGYSISDDPKKKNHNLSEVHRWFKKTYVGGDIVIPLGPLNISTRLAWTIANLLREGLSLSEIARTVACSTRCVSRHKQRLTKIGWLPPVTPKPTPHLALPNPERDPS